MVTPKLILITAFVFMLLSSGLSYLNKKTLAAKNDEIAQSHTLATAAQSEAARAAALQKKAQQAATDALSKTSDLQAQVATAGKQEEDLNSKVKEAEDRVKAKDTEIADLNTRLAAVANLPKPVAPPDAVVQQLAEVTRERDELNVVKAGFDAQVKAAQGQIATLENRIKARESGAQMAGLRGRVLAVDRNWNFVVLDLGNRNGVNNNATMIIQRGGSMVGRVRITSVEPSQSVADIIPNSVPAGISVQPGDTVVYSGS